MIEFSKVPRRKGREAYQWHRGFAAQNEHMFPRSWEEYRTFADEGQLWCARDLAKNGDYLGLAYSNFEDNKWEIGGLMVAVHARANGIGLVLGHLALGSVLYSENPLNFGHSVIVRIHSANSGVRPLIDKLGFTFAERIVRPAACAPGMAVNAKGEIEGEEFHMSNPGTLVALAEWAENWNRQIKNRTAARIVLGPNQTLQLWAQAFRVMAI